MFRWPQVWVVPYVYVMQVCIIPVPIRDCRFKPQIKARLKFIIMGNSMYFKTDAGLGEPDEVDFFEDRKPIFWGSVTVAEMDAKRNMIDWLVWSNCFLTIVASC